MKQTPPLFCNFRNALCAAGIASALGVGVLCPAAYAEPAVQAGEGQAEVSASQPAEISSAQLQELSSAAGQSTTQLVGEIKDSLAQGGIAASYLDPAADELPIVPYALGAATAVLGIGLFAGAYAALRHFRRSENPDEPGALLQPLAECPGLSLDDTASFVAVLGDALPSSKSSGDAPDECGASSVARGVAASTRYTTPVLTPASEGFDDLESFALGYAAAAPAVFEGDVRSGSAHATGAYEAALAELSHAAVSQDQAPRPNLDPDDGPGGAPAPVPSASRVAEAFSNTDLTLPFKTVNAPQSLEEFSATAKVLAAGTGKVHRVDTPSDHLDFSGMDVLSASGSTYHDAPAANPLIDYDDWRAVALSELRDEPCDPSPRQRLSTEELVGLIQTQSQPARAPKRQGFVAPVIGPGIDPVAAARRQEMMRASSSPAAALLVNRDEEFIARRAAQGPQQQGPVSAQPCDQAALNARTSGSRCPQPVSSARPGPAVGPSSVMSRVGVDMQSRDVPAASSFVAPRPPSYAAVVSDRGLSAAVAAASSAYAAFKGYTDAVSSPAVMVEDAGVSRAAMYASAVYGASEQPGQQTVVSPLRPRGIVQPCVGEETDASDAYIDYIVQDEFDHRHDSLSQRNAALGRIQVVNGSACPVPVRESVRRHRA